MADENKIEDWQLEEISGGQDAVELQDSDIIRLRHRSGRTGRDLPEIQDLDD